MSTPQHLFISYSSKDMEFAKKLYRFIVEHRYEAWFDVEKHHVGDWREPVKEAIRDSSAVLLIVTEASHKSANVKYEWEYALQEGVPIIPVLVSSIQLDQQLQGYRHVNFTNPDDLSWNLLLGMLVELYERLGITIFAPLAASEKLKRLTASLNSPLPSQNLEAVERLDKLRDEIQYIAPVFRQILTKRTTYDDQNLRIEVIKGIRRNPNPIFVPHLQLSLHDQSSTVRHIAAEALGELGDKSSESDLIATLKDQDPTVRMAAAYALGLLKSRHAVSHLQLLLQDEHAGARNRAQEALEQIEKS